MSAAGRPSGRPARHANFPPTLPKPAVPVYSGCVPEDVGGQPPASGEEPQNRDHGAADDGFAAVVFDEAFVQAAEIHEPSAVERMLAAAQARAEAEDDDEDDDGRSEYAPFDERYDLYDDWFEDAAPHSHGPRFGETAPYPYGAVGPYRGHVRWQRPVAWVLALVMGVGVVALAFSAVYRGVVSQQQAPTPPPATSDVERQPDTRQVPSP